MDRSASIRVAPERCSSGDIEIPGGAGEQWRFPLRTLSNRDCCPQVGTVGAAGQCERAAPDCRHGPGVGTRRTGAARGQTARPAAARCGNGL